MTTIFERDLLLPADVATLTPAQLGQVYASLQGRARRELDLNFGASPRLAQLHDSMSVVAARAREVA